MGPQIRITSLWSWRFRGRQAYGFNMHFHSMLISHSNFHSNFGCSFWGRSWGLFCIGLCVGFWFLEIAMKPLRGFGWLAGSWFSIFCFSEQINFRITFYNSFHINFRCSFRCNFRGPFWCSFRDPPGSFLRKVFGAMFGTFLGCPFGKRT